MNKSFKSRLKKNALLIGSWITIPDTNIIEIFSNFSFDWLCIDMEHSSITIKEIPFLTSLIESKNITPLVRIGEHDKNLIKRVMDCGSHGIIVADVRTAEQAKSIINSVKYPPYGTRGVGLYKAQNYGENFDDYNIWLQNESVIILQIEHIDALNNLDEILSLNDVDAIMIGPYDFSGSIGIPGDFKNKKYLNNLNLILKKSKKYKKTIGIHSISTNPNDCKDYIKKGYKFIACSLDTIFLMNSIKNYFTLLNKKTNE